MADSIRSTSRLVFPGSLKCAARAAARGSSDFADGAEMTLNKLSQARR